MRIATLGFLSDLMESIGIPYQYMDWVPIPPATAPPDEYFVGECIESPSATLEENGFQETTFILRGFTGESWMNLETYKETIERNIARTAILDDGTGVAVFYDSSMLVPTGVEGWKSIKINLKIQEWKVN